MKKSFLLFLFFISLLFLANKCNAQLGFFKYSTIYSGIGLNNSLNELNTYSIQNGLLTETTQDNKFNYRLAYGIKRLARLNFESKGKSYTDGSETTWGLFRSSLLNGLEYDLSFEKIRDRSLEFTNYNLWGRYLGSFYQIKIQSTNLEGIDLKYKELDIRLKKELKAFRFTVGGVYRFHNPWGVDPFRRDFNSNDDYESIAHDLGYYSEFYYLDINNNGYLDRTEQSFYRWFYDGNIIAETTNEFFKYHYSGIINQYNRDQLNLLGTQQTISLVMGGNWYKYNNTYHFLIWFNVLPYNKPLTEYGYINRIDYDLGALVKKEITQNMSFYLEGIYLSYLGRKNYNINTGINYLIR